MEYSHNCPKCKKPYQGFKNDISLKEYKISRLCQDCQDELFGEDNEPIANAKCPNCGKLFRDVYNPELHEWRIHKLEPKKLWPAIIWDATCGKYFLTRCLFSDESIKEYDAPGQSVVRLATAKDFAEGFQMEDIE